MVVIAIRVLTYSSAIKFCNKFLSIMKSIFYNITVRSLLAKYYLKHLPGYFYIEVYFVRRMRSLRRILVMQCKATS